MYTYLTYETLRIRARAAILARVRFLRDARRVERACASRDQEEEEKKGEEKEGEEEKDSREKQRWENTNPVAPVLIDAKTNNVTLSRFYATGVQDVSQRDISHIARTNIP